MTRRMLLPIVAAAALVALPAGARAQETPRPDTAPPAPQMLTPEPRSPGATLRVQVVISRYQGEKKIASLPYTLVVTTGAARARMRMGVETPVAVRSVSDSGKQTTSFEYKNLGTNIDCGAWDRRGGNYQLNLGVESSSALALEKGPSGTGTPPPVEGSPAGVPLFRSFNSSIDAMLRDGQSLQTIASTDPVTGEVVKIDVTMNVLR